MEQYVVDAITGQLTHDAIDFGSLDTSERGSYSDLIDAMVRAEDVATEPEASGSFVTCDDRIVAAFLPKHEKPEVVFPEASDEEVDEYDRFVERGRIPIPTDLDELLSLSAQLPRGLRKLVRPGESSVKSRVDHLIPGFTWRVKEQVIQAPSPGDTRGLIGHALRNRRTRVAYWAYNTREMRTRKLAQEAMDSRKARLTTTELMKEFNALGTGVVLFAVVKADDGRWFGTGPQMLNPLGPYLTDKSVNF